MRQRPSAYLLNTAVGLDLDVVRASTRSYELNGKIMLVCLAYGEVRATSTDQPVVNPDEEYSLRVVKNHS